MAYKEDSYYIERVLLHNDAMAFAGLLHKHKSMAFNIAFRITKNREDAEEVAQDAFIKVYHGLNNFKGESKFSSWLFRIVYNLALTKIRKKSLITGSIDDDNFYEQNNEHHFEALQTLQRKDQKRIIEMAIGKLDELDQLLINLYYMNDLSVEEIAEITDITQSNVKVRLFRSRKKMHDILESEMKNELHAIM